MNADTDEIINTYFRGRDIIVRHQISSYNYYVDSILPQIISQYFPVAINFNDENCIIHKVELDTLNIKVGKPLLVENNGCSKLMTPNMARLRNSTYLSPVMVDFKSSISIKDNEQIIQM